MTAAAQVERRRGRSGWRWPQLDYGLLAAAVALAATGLVMVASASVDRADRELGQPFYFVLRQAIYLGIGVLAGAAVFRLPLIWWSRFGRLALVVAVLLLMLVLVPGIGREVNGAQRWIDLGAFNLQVSEPAKLLVFIYLAGYLVRHGEALRERAGAFLLPVGLVSVLAFLLLLEPDFGGAAVLLATTLGLLFLAGVRLWQFGALVGAAVLAMAPLVLFSDYRMRRLTSFLDPWQDPFDAGFQLTQSLIAIGRGEWFGAGLGASVQKLFYLPEAHTDFVFAVLAEELGLVGVAALLLLYLWLVWRIFAIAERAEQADAPMAGYLAWAIGIWIGLQGVVNIGVNMGLLPTKGLTLPFLSYGGSSLVVMCIATALLLRIDHETRGSIHRLPARSPQPARRRARP